MQIIRQNREFSDEFQKFLTKTEKVLIIYKSVSVLSCVMTGTRRKFYEEEVRYANL